MATKKFSFNKGQKATSGKSTIRRLLFKALIPTIPPSEEEKAKHAQLFQKAGNAYDCVYCGASATDWDHFRPLVIDKKPTGFVSDIWNLVPACGHCNQSRGNKDWLPWMEKKFKDSINSSAFKDRIKKLQAYEAYTATMVVNFMGQKDLNLEINNYVHDCEALIDQLDALEQKASKIRESIQKIQR